MIRDQGHPCESIALSEVPQRLAQFDIVVSCTASSLPIIGLGMVNTALKNRRHQPMVMIDLAVPRDIEPEISKLRDVYLYTVDDLGKVVKEGMEYRTNAVKSAEEIINLQVKNFMHWLAQRSSVPFITSLKQRSEELQRVEIEKAKKRLNRGEDPADVMTELARGLANKFMHGSLHSLHHVDDDSVDDYQKMLTKIFMTESKRGGSC
jgi:glutamyl-tRNA reductase